MLDGVWVDRQEIYTDGCRLDGGQGSGWSAVVILDGKIDTILSGVCRGRMFLTNSHRVELFAIYRALTSVGDYPTTVYTDSLSFVRTISMSNCMRVASEYKDADLWRQIIKIKSKKNVMFRFVRSKSGNIYHDLAHFHAREVIKNKTVGLNV